MPLIVDERNMSRSVCGMMLTADGYILGGKPVTVSLYARQTLHELTSVASLIAKCGFLVMVNKYEIITSKIKITDLMNCEKNE
jgi:hypothetical protein